MSSWVFDIEGDGLNPTQIYCLAAQHVDGGEVFATTNYDDMRKMLTSAEVLIGHNIARFDIPVLERILKCKIKATIIDTLALSWVLSPERLKHGLEGYGEDYGIPKPVITDWENLPIEVYIDRCKEDVKINFRLWKNQLDLLTKIYGSQAEFWPFLKYIEFKMDCAREQERSQWKLDVEYCSAELEKLLLEKEVKTQELIAVMPRQPVKAKRNPPAKPLKKDGSLSTSGQNWLDLMAHLGLPSDHNEPVTVVIDTVEGNPGASGQIKEWLFSLGWVPQHIKHDKDKHGNPKEIPQIASDKKDGSICPSIEMLFEKEPALHALEGLTAISHRIGLLSGFLSNQQDGYIKAQIAGLTNTLRFKHSVIVNLPKVNRPYAEACRGSLIAGDKEILIGADMTSLEDRLKHHYLFPWDPQYVLRMSTPDYDPHIALAEMAEMITKEEADAYRWVSSLTEDEKRVCTDVRLAIAKRIKPTRDIAKNGNYACQYGAGASRIAITAGISHAQAKIVWEGYWKLNWAIRKVAETQKVKEVDGQLWLYNPISKFWYSLRYEKDRFSTLIQGSASFVFDKWVYNIRTVRPQLTAQFHDEVVLCEAEEKVEETKKLVNEALELTNEQLKLNRRLDIGVQTGLRYSEIH